MSQYLFGSSFAKSWTFSFHPNWESLGYSATVVGITDRRSELSQSKAEQMQTRRRGGYGIQVEPLFSGRELVLGHSLVSVFVDEVVDQSGLFMFPRAVQRLHHAGSFALCDQKADHQDLTAHIFVVEQGNQLLPVDAGGDLAERRLVVLFSLQPVHRLFPQISLGDKAFDQAQDHWTLALQL